MFGILGWNLRTDDLLLDHFFVTLAIHLRANK